MLAATILLVAVGLVMVYSSSAVLANRQYGDSLFFFKRQLIWAAVGLAGMALASRIPYTVWVSAGPVLFVGSMLLLILVLIPGMGTELNGSRRWFRLGPWTAQPSEMARLTVVIFLSGYLVRKHARIREFFGGFLPPVILVGGVLGLILAEPDLGTAVVLGAVAALLLFIGGARWIHIGAVGLMALPMLYALIMKMGYRRERMMAFLDPWQDPSDSGFQVIQSFIALGKGGIFGVGLGEGRQKLFFLPYPHTDFIFAVIGEETGLVGTLAVTGLFLALAWRGFSVALRAPDLFGRYLAFGLTLLVTGQAFVNMAVVTGLLPTKGLTLPFLSYGGSSLVFNLAAMGILLNISKAARRERSVLSHEALWSRSLNRRAGGKARSGACAW